MRPHGETLLDVRSAPVAFLGRETRGHSDHLMAGTFSLVFKDSEERAPTRVVNALGKIMVLHHSCHVQVLYADATKPLGIVLGGLEMEVTSLAGDGEMPVGNFLACLAAALTALLAAARGPLCVRQPLLGPAKVARILDDAAIGVGEKDLQAHVQPDRWVLTCLRLRSGLGGMHGSLLVVWGRLTHNERVPVPIRTQDQMGGHGRAHQRAVELDLQQPSQLGRHMQMRPVHIQPDITAERVLAQLNRVPAIGRLEAWKADRHSQVLHLEIAFERLAEPIRQRLDGGGRNMFAATSLEARREVILRGECVVRFILRFQHLQHLVIDGPRLNEAGHQRLALCAIGIQAVFKRSHALLVPS